MITVVLYLPLKTTVTTFEKCQSLNATERGFIDFCDAVGDRIVFSGSYSVLVEK